MYIRAVIASVKNIKGSKERADGSSYSYDFDAVTALVDGLDPVEINVPGEQRAAANFSRGEEVEIEVAFTKGTRLDFLRVVPQPAATKAG